MRARPDPPTCFPSNPSLSPLHTLNRIVGNASAGAHPRHDHDRMGGGIDAMGDDAPQGSSWMQPDSSSCPPFFERAGWLGGFLDSKPTCALSQHAACVVHRLPSSRLEHGRAQHGIYRRRKVGMGSSDAIIRRHFLPPPTPPPVLTAWAVQSPSFTTASPPTTVIRGPISSGTSSNQRVPGKTTAFNGGNERSTHACAFAGMKKKVLVVRCSCSQMKAARGRLSGCTFHMARSSSGSA